MDKTARKATDADQGAVDAGAGTGPSGDLGVISVTEEQAVVRKRERITGGCARPHDDEDEQIVAEPVVTERVEVERIPLDRGVEAACRCVRKATRRSSRWSQRRWWSSGA